MISSGYLPLSAMPSVGCVAGAPESGSPVMDSAGAAGTPIVMRYGAVTVCWPSLTATVISNVPAAAGVPPMIPVVAPSVSPAGNAPALTDHV